MRNVCLRRRAGKVLPALVPFLAWIFVSGCTTEPVTGRWQFLSFPEGELNDMGATAFQQVLSEAKLSTDAQQIGLVERVGRRIAAVTDRRMQEADRPTYQWEFKVIDAPDTVNAFALPGGKVAFYSGILPVCQTEAGVAVVMGHEIAHAYAQHGNERASRTALAQVGLAVATAALGGDEASENAKLGMAVLGLGYQVGVDLPFSRKEESAADHIGLYLMAEAGYDPREAAEFWRRMEQMSGGGATFEFLSTHPAHDTRVEQINEWLPGALEAYEQTRAVPAP